MLKAAKNMRGKLALLYRVTGRPGHRLHIFLNSTYELKLILCIPFTMLKAAKNMRGKLALLYRVTGRPGHRLHIFLNSTYERICAAAHICSVATQGPVHRCVCASFPMAFGPGVGPYFPDKHWVSGLTGWHQRQGMPGCSFPEGLCTLLVNHHVISQPSTAS